ncbi:MAG: DUF559 domain-containing protein [Gammaproteobacteria bacterium]
MRQSGARRLRKHPTDAERLLWRRLRLRQLGYKFRRQQPLGPYGGPGKGSTVMDNLASAKNGKRRRHYAATSTCRVSMVKGIPRSARTSRNW